MTLIETVQQDINSFLRQNKEFFFNERDLQMHLAVALRKNNTYDDVDVEYSIPTSALKSKEDYRWEEKGLRIDIVVRKDDEYCPIELKYKTKTVNEKKTIDRFGEQMDCNMLVKNQGARDLGMYGFWKDVYRLETVKRRFPKYVKGGVAIFLTNDEGYKCLKLKDDVLYANFSMSEGEHDKNKNWLSKDSKMAQNDNYPDFSLEKNYSIHWNDVVCEKECCYYTMVVI